MAELKIVDLNTDMVLTTANIPYGSKLFFKSGDIVKKGDVINTWDPFNAVIVSEVGGTLQFNNLVEGVTYRVEVDETSGNSEKIIIESKDRTRIPEALFVDESGEVHTGTAEIINGSTGEVVVSSVSISTKNGWQLVPYTTDMAHEKVDAQLLGFKINGAQTTKNGNAETFALSAPWEIAENSRTTLSYDAVVSAVSKAITEQEVLSVVFVLEWGGE